jgi:uncharacterized membrane protein YphA (DoxX/SURF4 family)
MGRRREIAKDVGLWILSLFLISIFLRQGIAKFDDTSGWADAFRLWHYPVWFRILIGVAETTAAVLLVTRRTATFGAIIIMVVMLGGMATHVLTGHPRQVTSEVLPLAVATIVAIGRRKSMWRPHTERVIA